MLRSPSAASGARNIALLALCQALAMTGNNILSTTAALVGYSLLVDKSWSTLPTALQMTGTMLAVIPASLLMGRFGRRNGFTIGAAIGATGAAVATSAIFSASFALFCLGTMLLGSYNGFVAYYRFAAADTTSPRLRSRAISLVLAGGVVAAVFGPEAAKWSRSLFDPVLFAGCYLVIFALCATSMLMIRFIDIPRALPAVAGSARSLASIMRQPAFYLAAPAGMIAYGVMSLVMTATPLAMLQCQLSFESAAFVIQWHALGMYAPSFVTGHLIGRFGVLRVMFCGVVLLCLCAAIALSGIDVMQFWAALMLLGIGWNFLYVGATTLLTEAYTPAERAKTQAANDFLIFATVAPASLSSGLLLHNFGWSGVVIVVLPFAAMILVLLRARQHQMRAGAVVASP